MFDKNISEKKGLKIIIVGCGKIGTTLTEKLSAEGHDITIIDKNAKTLRTIAEMYDVMGIVGNGASYSVQEEADIENTDLIIAVTDSDELNLLCCIVAKRAGNCAAIARVRTPDYCENTADINYLRKKLGLAMIINPDLEAANEAARVLSLPTALEVSTFAHNHAEMIKLEIPENNLMDGQSIVNISKNSPAKILICAVERNGKVFIPSGDFILRAGDLISFTASRENVRIFLKNIGFQTTKVKDTIIVGGGRASYYLAKQLLNAKIDVKIIEKDLERCEELSILLPEAVIIHADGTDEEVLKEEGIEYTEAFVPLTGIDEENVMLTLHAKNVSNAKVVTKINKITFKNVLNNLELGSIIYPKNITSELIIAYVRARTASKNSNIETLYHMFDDKAEAIEFLIDKKSEIIDIPLKDLKLKDNLLITIINRNGKIIIPKGNDCIEMGDTVVIVTTHTGFNEIQDILK